MMKWSGFLLLTVTLGHLIQPSSSIVAQEAKSEKSASRTDEERRAIQAKADALAAKGSKGVEALAKQVREGKTEWQVAALRALRNLGSEAAPALEPIVDALQSKDLRVKRLAVGTIKAIGPKAKSAVPALIEAAKETGDFNGSFAFGGSSNVAEAALEAVQTLDPSAIPELAKAMIPGLLQVIKREREGAATNALALLRQLGPHAKPALPKLKEALPTLPPRSAHDCLPVFLAAGEEGMAILADFLVDPKTDSGLKVALLEGYRWEKRTTPSAVRILRTLLEDEKPAVRAAAVQVLATVRSKELVPKLAGLLDDGEIVKVRSDFKGDDEFRVARALGNQGKDAVEVLIAGLDNKKPLARFQAARALALIGRDAKKAAPSLENMLEDPVPLLQLQAAGALLKCSKDSDKGLKKLKEHLQADSRLRGAALQLVTELGRSGQALLPAVKRLTLESKEVPLQHSGFRALEALQADSKEIVEVWVALLKKDRSFLNFPPADAIRGNRKEAQAALPALREYFKDRDVNTRRRVTEAMTALGPAAAKAIPALIEALDEDSFVAHGAMEALGAMGDLAKPAVAPLVRKFDKIKPSDREPDYSKDKILTTLAQIGPGAVEAVPALLKWLPDNPAAARVLGRIGPGTRTAVPALEKMYERETGYSKAWSAFALVKITGTREPYVSSLVEMFQKSKNPEHRHEALLALVELGPDARSALPAFLMALKEKEERKTPLRDNRQEAAKALVHFGPEAKEAVPYLIDMVETSYFAAKVTAAEALGAIGPAAKEAVPALEKMMAEDPRYQPVVEKALAKIRAK
ncbi:MAG TPA: HEAT repeat domain-containing protein [Gemmataceae bacterium]|jgi:HEAT repeat protein